jgi:hypothetical protein
MSNNVGDLVSNVDATIDSDNWQAEGPIFVTRNLNPPGIPTAKIVFKRKDGFKVSAFWCWA